MAPLLVLVCVLGVLYLFVLMFRFTFDLIERAHERLREESRDPGTPLTQEQEV